MNTSDFYDSYWENHVHPAEWDEEKFRREFGPLLGRHKVLDYGCGRGICYQNRLSKMVNSYTGADVSPIALEVARSKGLEAVGISPDNGTMELPENIFDGAVCVEVFEHLFDPLAAAREIHRVMQPGGVFIATVPNFGYHAWRLLAFLRAQVPSEPEDRQRNRFNGVHIRFFSKLMLKRLLRDAGFTNITIGSYDNASVWDVFLAAGHFAHISEFASRHFPGPLHLRFLQDVWPNVFAMRLRAIAYKPQKKQA
jgi:SAM-dependent methyltransferase